jgi:YaiO family outer membrane protein
MKRVLPLLALALVSAAPPAGDPETLYREGVAARHAGDSATAVRLLRQAVEASPDDADAWLQLGLALGQAGRIDEAEAALARTLALAPDYRDAREALDRLAARRAGDAAPEPRWRADLDGSWSALSAGQPDWYEAALRIRGQASPEGAVTAAAEAARRFGATDVYGELRVDARLSDSASAYVRAGGTPDADFRPKWQVGAGGAVRLRGGPAATVATLDASQARYRSGDVQTVTPGIEQYVAGGRAWLTGRWINLFDENGRHRSGWLARGDYMASDRLRLFAGAADAPDVSEGVVTDVFTLFGGAAVAVSPRTELRLSVAHEDRARGADRLQVGMGLGLRF